MNRVIKEQLAKCKVAKMPEYTDDVLEIIIPKTSNEYSNSFIDDDLQINHQYKIKVDDYIIKPYEGFTLHANWNNNIIPKEDFMICEVTQTMGKMIKIDSVGVTTKEFWSGWLPRKSIHVIEEVK